MTPFLRDLLNLIQINQELIHGITKNPLIKEHRIVPHNPLFLLKLIKLSADLKDLCSESDPQILATFNPVFKIKLYIIFKILSVSHNHDLNWLYAITKHYGCPQVAPKS